MFYFYVILAAIFIIAATTLYEKLGIPQKRQILIDLCVFLVMLIVTIATGLPETPFLILSIFFLWTVCGNILRFLGSKFNRWSTKLYLKINKIPQTEKNIKEEEDRSHNIYSMRLLYFSMEIGLCVLFIIETVLDVFVRQ